MSGKCWLKLQHKLEIFRRNILSKAEYVADLGYASNDSMQEFDAKVRRCVRRILEFVKTRTFTRDQRTEGWESGKFLASWICVSSREGVVCNENVTPKTHRPHRSLSKLKSTRG